MYDIAVRVEELGKVYRIGSKSGRYRTLRDTLADAIVAPFRHIHSRFQRPDVQYSNNTIWALKDVSFEVKRGEVVGIIGHNGAGKSTLLKILSRITEPTAGLAEIHGRVGSLLEVGTGFHPELTGQENIYLNGAILGMKKAEIDRKFDEIVAFAEVEKFIDTPVKHYSSGMYLRLAFAVAAHLEPEILLVDEVLAVGDAAFQKKCLGKMEDVAKEGRTVLFVSHNMGAIVQLCGKALWIESGRLRLTGSPPDVVAPYLSSGIVTCSTWTHSFSWPSDQSVQIESVQIHSGNDNHPSAVVRFDRRFQIGIGYQIVNPIRNLSILCRMIDSQGNIICTSWDTDTTDRSGCVRDVGRYLSVCHIPGKLLRPGRYFLSVGYVSDMKIRDYHENVLAFDISEVGYHLNLDRVGIITPLLEWNIKRTDEQTRVLKVETE
jgi:lipopolysaccharide transport system ATP-binding protein